MYNHTINTTLGKFHFGWAGVDSSSNWISGRFEEPAKAKKVYPCNPFTGKYNFHGMPDFSAIAQLMNFLEDLKTSGRILTKKEAFTIEHARKYSYGYILGEKLTPFVTDTELLTIIKLKDELAEIHNTASERRKLAV